MTKNEYNNHSKQERQSKGQFFTPDLVLEKMFKYVTKTGTLLDNSMGSGNILAYAIQKRGFEPSKCYGIEFDPEIYEIAVERLTQLGIPKENLVLGDALSRDSYRFGHFDLAVINPPYKIGNKVCWEALNRSDFVVCLMPLSKYKKGKLWSKITQFSLADPKLFTDAQINENLSICGLSNTETPKYKDIEEFELDSFDQDLRLVYKWNQTHSIFSERSGVGLESSLIKRGVNNKTWFATGVRAPSKSVGVQDKGGWDYKWNHKTEDTLKPCSNGLVGVFFYKMDSEKAKDNLTKWYYHSRAKDCLANRLLWGLKKDSGTVEVALPQIDFSKIEESPLWKQGLYDEAVLDAMNLKMVNGVVVKKNL